MTLSFHRLSPRDMPEVIALEYTLCPRDFCSSVAKAQEILSVPHIKGQNFSLGAYDGSRLVGYVILFETNSARMPVQRVALLWEIAIVKEYRSRLSQHMLRWCLREARQCGLPIEGFFRIHTGLRLVQRETHLFSAAGYTTGDFSPHTPVGGEQMMYGRFDPIPASAPLAQALSRVEVWVARKLRATQALPLRLVRRVCALAPALTPLPLRQRTYLAPWGSEPPNVRSDLD